MTVEQRFESSKLAEEAISEEDSYNEEEDEDFDPSKDVNTGANDSEEDIGDDNKHDDGPDYSKIESGQGGLVRTRRARELEEESLRQNKYESLRETGVSQRTSSLWGELQQESIKRLRTSISVMSETVGEPEDNLKEELVLIDRKYEFAGEILHEKKWVPKFSAEAQEFKNSTKFKSQNEPSAATKVAVNEQGAKLRRPLKRPPILEQIIAGALKPKLTTLEKSKLDWASYVDKEGINAELNLHNKDGYLAKQDFLNRVESFKDDKYRQMRKTQLQQRLADT
ncbi:LANO_0F02102g1_1 [Lachancea nothofagi CBS 11611]|uniref:SWR1-complex protein 5 n=1 Tax=Lachancea nothofagi CBS 11611 TaxID=1266666 RepID=A0A1G4K6P1_9SACH|nr:LANO_0F02102g1_1 [Lachancea nothofagi CBS 11611]